MKKTTFILALLLVAAKPDLTQRLSTDDTQTNGNRFRESEAWADFAPGTNGGKCSPPTDDSTALNTLWSAVAATGNELRICDNANLTKTPRFATPTSWVHMHQGGRLFIGNTVKPAPFTLWDGSFSQRNFKVNFQLLPQAPLIQSSCGSWTVVDLSAGSQQAWRNIGIQANGAGYGCFTGIGFNETSTADVYLENVSALTNSSTAQPLLATGSFGLRVSKSQFDPGPLGTKPCITLQDNAENGDTIRWSMLYDDFCAHQGILWTSSGSYSWGNISEGLDVEDFLYESANVTGYKDALTLDTTSNGRANLYLKNIYVADSTGCTLNTGSGFNGVATVEIIEPIGGGCLKGRVRIDNLFAHVNTHIANFAGITPWTGMILSDGNLSVTSLLLRTGQNPSNGIEIGQTTTIGAIPCANDRTTGTHAAYLVKINASGNCQTLAEGDSNVTSIGVCIQNCGTSGNPTISTVGPVMVRADSASFDAGDYATQVGGGLVHDAGTIWPTTGRVVGIILPGGSSGIYNVWLFGPGTPGAAQTLSATTRSIGGSQLTAGQCASGTVSVADATTRMTVSVSPNTYPGDGFIPWGYVSANGTVTVKVCAKVAGTPTASVYNVRVIQ